MENDREREEWFALTLTLTTLLSRHSPSRSQKIRTRCFLCHSAASFAPTSPLSSSHRLPVFPPRVRRRHVGHSLSFLHMYKYMRYMCIRRLSYGKRRPRDRCSTWGQLLEIDESLLNMRSLCPGRATPFVYV